MPGASDIPQAWDTLKVKVDFSDNIRGIDANHNGIRDDIEDYIEQKYSNPNQRKAVKQYARALQSSLLVNTANKDAVALVTEQKIRATNCLALVMPHTSESDRPVRKILGMTVNTKTRMIQYLTLDKVLDSTNIVVKNTLHNVCDA